MRCTEEDLSNSLAPTELLLLMGSLAGVCCRLELSRAASSTERPGAHAADKGA